MSSMEKDTNRLPNKAMFSLMLIVLLANVLEGFEREFLEFTVRIIKYSFNNGHCVCYFGNSSWYINAALTEVNIAVMRQVCYYPTGYLAFLLNFEQLEKTRLEFLPYKKLLIFTPGLENFDRHFINRAVDVITVHNYNSDLEPSNKLLQISFNYIKDVLTTNKLNRDLFSRGWLQPAFTNRTFKVSTFNFPPYSKVDESGALVGGMEKYILDVVAKDWPLQIVVDPPYSWDDQRQKLKDKILDLAMCAHPTAYVVKEGIDISYSYFSAMITFMVPKPHPLPLETFVFQPIQVNVWLSTIAFILATSAVSYLILREQNYFIWTFDIFRAVFLNPYSIHDRYRLIMLLVSIFSVLFGTNYSAGFTSGLAAPRYSRPIKTFQDMYENHIKTDDPNITDLLDGSEDVSAQNLAKSNFYDPPSKLKSYIAAVIGEYVFFQDPISVETKKSLRVLSDNLGFFHFVMPLQKNSPYTKFFERGILKFTEHGLIEAWFRFTMYEDFAEILEMPVLLTYFSNSHKQKKALNLEQLQGGFYILFIGQGLSVLAFIIERMQWSVNIL